MRFPNFEKFTLMNEPNSTTSDKTELNLSSETITRMNYNREIKEFFIWLVRDADIDVLDAENAIEVRSLEDKQGFVPVMTIDELIKHYRECSNQKP